jgi:tetratricopeptide (TPR) repeat protein
LWTKNRHYRGAAALFCAAVVLLASATAASADSGVTSRRPNSQAYFHYSLGRLLEVSGALSDALVQYRRADTLDPDHCDIGVAVARTLYSIGDLEHALRRVKTALELCPDNLEALAIHAELLLLADEAEEAGRVIEKQATDPNAPREFAALYGQALLSQGRIEEGADYLRARAEADSLDPDISSMYGRALLMLGDSEAAVSELRRALRLDPDDRIVAGMLSRLLIALQRPEEGVPLLEWIVSRFRAVQPELVSLAAGYSLMEEHDRAHAVLDTAEARFGETPAILRARGATHYGEGDIDGAIDAYERLLRIDEDSVTALNFIAYTLADENRDLGRALDYANRAVELEPDNPLLRDTLGWAHFRRGEIEEARRELDLAIELGGDNPVILEHLGDVLLELDRADEAISAWTRALELAPGTASTIERIEDAGGTPPAGPEGENP